MRQSTSFCLRTGANQWSLLLGRGEMRRGRGTKAISTRACGYILEAPRDLCAHFFKPSLKKKPLVTLAQAYTTCVNTRKHIILRPFREMDTSVPLFQLLWNLRERQPVSTLFFPSYIFFNWTADFLLKLYLSVYCCTLWTCISAPWGQKTVQPF